MPDDNKWWIDLLYGVIAALWAVLAVIWGYVWKEVAMKGWVKEAIAEHGEADVRHDRQLFEDLIAPVSGRIEAMENQTERMHRENRALLDEILRTVKGTVV
jgi:hypothetical protein